MSLVRAERRRFAKRRLVRWLVPVGLLLLSVVIAGIFISHDKPTAAAKVKAEAAAQQDWEQQTRWYEERKRDCERADADQEMCGYVKQESPPPRDQFLAEHYMPPQFNFKENYASLLLVWAAIFAMISFVLGASFVGAEWASGSMMNLLTWRPKRTGVLATKLTVLLGWLTAIGVGTLAVWTGALWLVAYLRGSNAGMTQGTWMSFGLGGLRGLGLILAFGAIGFCLASIGRHTGLALGVALAVIIVGQFGVGIVLSLAQVKFLEQYLIPVHLDAWMNKRSVIQDWSQMGYCGSGDCQPPQIIISWGESGSIAAGVIVFLLVVAFWRMRGRDIA